MTSTRRHDVFTKNTNPLYKIYMPTNPDHEPPQYFPRQGRRQIYDFLQSKVNVHMKFCKSSNQSISTKQLHVPARTRFVLTLYYVDHMKGRDGEHATTKESTLRTVKPGDFHISLKERIQEGSRVKGTMTA
jgi:hypothetical protein